MQQPAQWQLLSQGRELPAHGYGSTVKKKKEVINDTMIETRPIFITPGLDC